MFIGLLSILAAIVLSLVSAFFSVTGIVTIFSGAVIGAALMGSTLEFSKIVSTIWLYQWWKTSSKLLRTYLVFAVMVLILISSIGIYAFLSRAYVGQRNPGQEIGGQITRIDLNIDREERNIDRAQEALDLLDQSIEQYLSLNAISLGLQRREEQRPERDALRQEMVDSQIRIDEYLDERFRLENQLNEFSVNVGPIEYIAIFIYGEEDAESNFDRAARLFIVLLVLVFDPFAVLLMVAGNISIDNRKVKRKRNVKKRKSVPSKSGPKNAKVERTNEQPDVSDESRTTEKTEDQEIPTEAPTKKKRIVEVDMSDYIDPSEIKNLKETTEHHPFRKKPKDA